MSTQNLGFLEKNAQRAYPVEERASGIDVSGRRLSEGILVDLNLRFDGDPDTQAYVGSVHNTPEMISVSISRDDALKTPLASVSLPKPVDVYRNYRLQPLRDGVLGWIVFGPAVEHGPYGTWRFDDSSSSRLRHRCARPGPGYGVLSIRESRRSRSLQGLIELRNRSEGALKIRRLDREIDGQTRSVVAIGLDVQQGGKALFQRLTGPCGGVPESGTCGQPEIRSISGVVPDCQGVIRLKIVEEIDSELGELFTLQDPATAPDPSWVRVDSEIGIEETCDRPKIDTLLDQVDLCDTYDLDVPDT